MPIPLYTLLLAKYFFKVPINFSDFIDIYDISSKKIIYTVFVFLLWVVILLVVTILAGFYFPHVFSAIVESKSQIIDNIGSISGGKFFNLVGIPSSAIIAICFSILSAVIAGLTINLVFGIAEEVLWRGYLWKELESWHFVAKNFFIGILWGLWHTPLLFFGYCYGVRKSIPTVIFFVIFCICFSYLYGMIAEKTKNALYSGMFHAIFNGFAGIFMIILVTYNPFLDGSFGVLSMISILISAIFIHAILSSSSIK